MPNVSNNEAGFFSKTGEIVVHAKGTADTFWHYARRERCVWPERFGQRRCHAKSQPVDQLASMEKWASSIVHWREQMKFSKHKVKTSIDAIPPQIAQATSAGHHSVYGLCRYSKIYLNNPIAKNVEKLNESTSEAAIGFLKSAHGGTM